MSTISSQKIGTEANYGIKECEDSHLIGNAIMICCESIHGLETGEELYPFQFIDILKWNEAGIIK